MNEPSTSLYWSLEKTELELITHQNSKILMRRFYIFGHTWLLEANSEGNLYLQLENSNTRDEVRTKSLLTITCHHGHYKVTIGSWKQNLTFNHRTTDRHSISDRFINPKLFKLMCKDELTMKNPTVGIEFHLHVANLNNNSSSSSSPEPGVIPEFEKLLNETDFADFTLVARGGRVFRVHRALLAARSSVFEAMLTSDMSEKKLGRATIVDIGPDALRELLRYIYCGKVEDLDEERAEELLRAAEKYELEGLKLLCLEELCKELSEKNVVDLYQLSSLCSNADVLKNRAVEFMVDNMKDMVYQPIFNTILDNKQLSKEIIRKLTFKSR